jgi:hypothetical protein
MDGKRWLWHLFGRKMGCIPCMMESKFETDKFFVQIWKVANTTTICTTTSLGTWDRYIGP